LSSFHPWADKLVVREEIDVSNELRPPHRDPAPLKYNDKRFVRPPHPGRIFTLRESVTLEHVDALREATASIKRANEETTEVSKPSVANKLLKSFRKLSLDLPTYRVLYRFTQFVFDEEYAILEAVHFEIFMPDRPDLRFIQLPLSSLYSAACEGDYFEVLDVEIARQSRHLTMGEAYSVTWSVKEFTRVNINSVPITDYVYAVQKDKDTIDLMGVCNQADNFIVLRASRFVGNRREEAMTMGKMYEATLVDASSAWIYPVEPPKNVDEYARMIENIQSVSSYSGTIATSIRLLCKSDKYRILDRLGDFREFSENAETAEKMMIKLFQLGVRYRQLITPPRAENVYVSSFDPPVLQTFSEVFIVQKATLHFDDVNFTLDITQITRQNQGTRKSSILVCAPSPELVSHSDGVSPGLLVPASLHYDTTSATLETIKSIEDEVHNKRKGETTIPKMLQYLYGTNEMAPPVPGGRRYTIQKVDGSELALNERQSNAFIIYHQLQNSGYCILSPPGSGKTTVAAAMAASLAMERKGTKEKGVQLLLAVQNVAVENLAFSLKTFDQGDLHVYRMLSKLRLNLSNKSPYDIFEHLPEYKRWLRSDDKERELVEQFTKVDGLLQQAYASLSQPDIEELEKMHDYLLGEAKSALEQAMKPEIILATVDMILYRQMNGPSQGLRTHLAKVDRVIIDEASLLTESTLYCLIRCFPKASFVLIGDDKQLPPFKYEEKIRGHELAGRSALSVALRKNNLQVIQLLEVYRAPQCLVEPYNNLSYEGRLISRKIAKRRPLFFADLVERDRPDLLLVEIPAGSQGEYLNQINHNEIAVLVKVLGLFPKSTHDDIMIICLYNDQKKAVQKRLGYEYDIFTVDASQGKEKPIVIVLTTRTDDVTDFFHNWNRCTVAVSRHQCALIILGNSSLLSSHPPWSTVLSQFTRIDPSSLPRPKWNPNAPEFFPRANLLSFPPLPVHLSHMYLMHQQPPLSLDFPQPVSPPSHSPPLHPLGPSPPLPPPLELVDKRPSSLRQELLQQLEWTTDPPRPPLPSRPPPIGIPNKTRKGRNNQ
ncbi:hypothetical protein PFISCL1PPCAC_5563, partial [Pristionchus fissidentatus]